MRLGWLAVAGLTAGAAAAFAVALLLPHRRPPFAGAVAPPGDVRRGRPRPDHDRPPEVDIAGADATHEITMRAR